MQLWPSPPPIPPKTEADDVQCPQCGKYGATVSFFWRDRTTGDLFQAQSPLDTGKIIALWLGSSVVLLVVANALLGSDSFGLPCLQLAPSPSHTSRSTTGEACIARPMPSGFTGTSAAAASTSGSGSKATLSRATAKLRSYGTTIAPCLTTRTRSERVC